MLLEEDEVTKIVQGAAARFSKVWWMDRDDLTQVGQLAALRARETFNPRVGASPQQYLWRTVVFAMKRACWESSAPVSGGKHRPEESLRGLHRAGEGALSGRPSEAPTADVALDDARWRGEVRAQLARLVDEDEVSPDAVVRVLLDETKPCGDRTRRACLRLRRRLVFDRRLYELMCEKRKG